VEVPRRPVRLERAHVREGFRSGAPELDEWLVKYAWENQRAHNATTFVTLLGERVVGYYSLTVASVAKEEAPERLATVSGACRRKVSRRCPQGRWL
jgi:hypothetical protein